MTEYTAIDHETQTVKNGKRFAAVDFGISDASAVTVTFFEDGVYNVRVDQGNVSIIRIA